MRSKKDDFSLVVIGLYLIGFPLHYTGGGDVAQVAFFDLLDEHKKVIQGMESERKDEKREG